MEAKAGGSKWTRSKGRKGEEEREVGGDEGGRLQLLREEVEEGDDELDGVARRQASRGAKMGMRGSLEFGAFLWGLNIEK